MEERPGSGLVQVGARWYWPELGRFLQQDPDKNGINWYAYVGNNPVKWIDPEGLRLSFFGDRCAINEGLAYLPRVPKMKKIINDLRYSRTKYRIVANVGQKDRYEPGWRTIHWDPHAALRTTAGGRVSPALMLGHELGHARGPMECSQWDARYDDKEERRVIVHIERPAAVFLREDARYDHSGAYYYVPTPTAR